MRRRAVVAVFAAAVAATALTTPGAGTRSGTGLRIDVSSVPAAKQFLRSVGIDAAGFVVQRGRRNYAGPNCPGRSWVCTTSTRVIQIAGHGGENKFECEPSSHGTSHATKTCVITQSSSSGNTARCVIRSTDVANVEQTCRLTQTSGKGDNHAFVEMVVRQSDGSQHKALQKAVVTQTSESGANRLHSMQKVEQDAKRHGGTVHQKQDGKLTLLVDQRSGSGKQLVQMHQSLDQDAKADGSVLGGSQDQLGDLFGDIDQRSSGRSEIHARQHEDQDEHAPKGSNVAQEQIGPETCCTTQIGNPNDRFDINQSASQEASQDDAFQSELINGSCISSGLCDVDQSARINIDHEKNSCRGHVCFIFIRCTSGEDGGEANVRGERFLAAWLHERGCEAGSTDHTGKVAALT